ncbi:hypothetical protein SAMN05443253_12025 [Bacillus sp. OK048]|nr:hypothetical protein SAMN05443253_12025 [Bacillus sp. OK048]
MKLKGHLLSAFLIGRVSLIGFSLVNYVKKKAKKNSD